jgi:hypothetical protein
LWRERAHGDGSAANAVMTSSDLEHFSMNVSTNSRTLRCCLCHASWYRLPATGSISVAIGGHDGHRNTRSYSTCCRTSYILLFACDSSEATSYRGCGSAGALLATGGAIMMVYGAASVRQGPVGSHISRHASPVLGAVCLLGNCTAMAAYFVVARSVGPKYPSLCLTVRSRFPAQSLP